MNDLIHPDELHRRRILFYIGMWLPNALMAHLICVTHDLPVEIGWMLKKLLFDVQFNTFNMNDKSIDKVIIPTHTGSLVVFGKSNIYFKTVIYDTDMLTPIRFIGQHIPSINDIIMVSFSRDRLYIVRNDNTLYEFNQEINQNTIIFSSCNVVRLKGTILTISSGDNHTIVLTSEGLYGRGMNRHGILGEPEESHNTFERIFFDLGKEKSRVLHVLCDAYTILLTDDYRLIFIDYTYTAHRVVFTIDTKKKTIISFDYNSDSGLVLLDDNHVLTHYYDFGGKGEFREIGTMGNVKSVSVGNGYYVITRTNDTFCYKVVLERNYANDTLNTVLSKIGNHVVSVCSVKMQTFMQTLDNVFVHTHINEDEDEDEYEDVETTCSIS